MTAAIFCHRVLVTHPSGRLDEVHIDDDGAASRFVAGRGWVAVNLNEYVTADASEAPAAAAGDGPREVLAAAGAVPGHHGSVGAAGAGDKASIVRGVDGGTADRAVTCWAQWVDGRFVVIDDPVDSDDLRAVTEKVMSRMRNEPTEPAPPSPGPCPSPGCYGRQRRERGEVRVRLWACGCPVRPTTLREVPDGRERMWEACGDFCAAYHPTRDGAIAAWREALAAAQRAEDAQ